VWFHIAICEPDHCKYIGEILDYGIKTYSNFSAQGKSTINKSIVFDDENNETFKVGSFYVTVFPVKHDVKNTAFVIQSESFGRLLFITDTAYIEYQIPDVNHYLIEANYEDSIMDKAVQEGHIESFVARRIKSNHMSLDTCIKTILSNGLNKVRTVILTHLSNNNSHADMFQEKVEKATGKRVFIGDKDLTVNLSSLF